MQSTLHELFSQKILMLACTAHNHACIVVGLCTHPSDKNTHSETCMSNKPNKNVAYVNVVCQKEPSSVVGSTLYIRPTYVLYKHKKRCIAYIGTQYDPQYNKYSGNIPGRRITLDRRKTTFLAK